MSNGISMATIPDVCKTPTPGGPVPIPYPNIAQSITLSNGTTTVKGDKVMAANKGSKFTLSNGDNAGTIGGVKSNVFMKEATWLLYSFDVKMDSKNACRFTDPMYHNSENTVNMSGVVNPPISIADFEEILKECENQASDKWNQDNPNTNFKTFCNSQANRTARGDKIGEDASACVDKAMNDRGSPNQVSLDQSFRGTGSVNSVQALGKPGQVIANTARPDVVLHAPGVVKDGVTTIARGVYDFKAPCPPGSNAPHWSGNQGADYLSIFGVIPKLVSPGNMIVTGALGSSAGAVALRLAARLLRIPIPWP
jgi:hypothetical protein